MKTIKLIIFSFLLFVISYSTKAAVISVIATTGDWQLSSTWDLNRIPRSGDLVIVPEGKTVEVSSNQYNSVPSQPLLIVQIYGILKFVGTGQLNVQCESTICTFNSGIILSSGCNCNQITMGVGLAPWVGTDASITGGACVNSPCNSTLKFKFPLQQLYSENKISNSTLLVSPNPTIDKTTVITLNDVENSDIKVIDLSGNEILVSKNFSGNNDIKIEFPTSASNGIYFVIVTDLNNRYSKRIIVR